MIKVRFSVVFVFRCKKALTRPVPNRLSKISVVGLYPVYESVCVVRILAVVNEMASVRQLCRGCKQWAVVLKCMQMKTVLVCLHLD